MDKDFVLKIAKNIKKYRGLRGMRQIDLAADSDISLSMVSMLETAKTDVNLSKLKAIAKALGIEPWQLLKFDD